MTSRPTNQISQSGPEVTQQQQQQSPAREQDLSPAITPPPDISKISEQARQLTISGEDSTTAEEGERSEEEKSGEAGDRGEGGGSGSRGEDMSIGEGALTVTAGGGEGGEKEGVAKEVEQEEGMELEEEEGRTLDPQNGANWLSQIFAEAFSRCVYNEGHLAERRMLPLLYLMGNNVND